MAGRTETTARRIASYLCIIPFGVLGAMLGIGLAGVTMIVYGIVILGAHDIPFWVGDALVRPFAVVGMIASAVLGPMVVKSVMS